MIISHAGCRTRRSMGNGCHQTRLLYHEDTTLIGSHPDSTLLILKDIVSPGCGIFAGLIIGDEIEQLSGSSVIKVDAVVCTDPNISIPIFINLAHTVVCQRSRRIVLLIPYYILIFGYGTLRTDTLGITNQSVGTAHPPFAIAGLEDGMQKVTLSRKSNLIERSETIEGMGR